MRLRNETELLERAFDKPLFGWGGWARARVFDEEGRNTSVTDGLWIIVMGERGWIGYLSFFGFLALPILRLAHTARRKEVPWAVLGPALACAANFIGLLFFGTLAAFVQYDTVVQASEAETGPARVGPRYARFNDAPEPESVRADNTDRPAVAQSRPDAVPYRR